MRQRAARAASLPAGKLIQLNNTGVKYRLMTDRDMTLRGGWPG